MRRTLELKHLSAWGVILFSLGFFPISASHAQGSADQPLQDFCMAALLGAPGASIEPVIGKPLSEESDQPLSSLKLLEKNLGFEPVLKHEIYTHGQSLSLLYADRKTVFASMTFHINKTHLEVDFIRVASNLRQYGISRYLTTEILARYPAIRSIKSSLAEQNLELFHQAFQYLSDLGHLTDLEICIEAIKNTPAYRLRRGVGFTRIVSCHPGEFLPGRNKYLRDPSFTVIKER